MTAPTDDAKYVSRVTSSYAHDARQLMNVFEIAQQQLNLTLRTKRQQELVSSMLVAMRNLGSMFEDQLLVSRLQNGVASVEQKGIALAAVLNDVRSNVSPATDAARIALRVIPTRMEVLSDPRHLRRVVQNLVVNAITHSGATRLTLGARRLNDGFAVDVIDNGRGIPAAEREAVFIAGFRGQGATNGELSEGRGLGLWIVRELSKLMGGDVLVSSVVGQGSRFRVVLPGPIKVGQRLFPAQGPGSTNLSGRLVVLLEDHAQTLRLLESAFAGLGAAVIAAENQMELVQRVMAAERMPDLVIMDFMLGRDTADLALGLLQARFQSRITMGGSESGKLKRRRVPIVIVTGHPEHEGLRNISKEIPVIQKPMTAENFKILSEVAAGRRHLTQEDFLS